MDSIKGVLELIVPRLIGLIMDRLAIEEQEAFTRLYSSQLYAQLERDETKLWHLSVPALFELFNEEQQTGRITYPEEA
ncbi:MAG: hypothetical protein LBD16_07185 [Oscillospiraceae bacterium]|nr:hypothetical protein [Oscillospiraceae bacterium]